MAKQVIGSKREDATVTLLNEHSTKPTSNDSLSQPQLSQPPPSVCSGCDYHRDPHWSKCRRWRMLSPNGTDKPYAFLPRSKHRWRGQKECTSQKQQMTTRKQCFQNTAGQLHIQNHIVTAQARPVEVQARPNPSAERNVNTRSYRAWGTMATVTAGRGEPQFSLRM